MPEDAKEGLLDAYESMGPEDLEASAKIAMQQPYPSPTKAEKRIALESAAVREMGTDADPRCVPPLSLSGCQPPLTERDLRASPRANQAHGCQGCLMGTSCGHPFCAME